MFSPDGGREPIWGRSSRELFYRNLNRMMVVVVFTEPEFRAGSPGLLFEGRFGLSDTAFGYPRYDVSPGGNGLATARIELQPGGHLSFFVDGIDSSTAVDFTDFQGLLKATASGKTGATVIQTRPGQFATMP